MIPGGESWARKLQAGSKPSMQGSVANTYPSACRLLIGRRKSWRVPVGVSWRGLQPAFKASARPIPPACPVPAFQSSFHTQATLTLSWTVCPPAAAGHGRAPGPSPALPLGFLPSRLQHPHGTEGEYEPVAGGHGVQALLVSGGSRRACTQIGTGLETQKSGYQCDLP